MLLHVPPATLIYSIVPDDTVPVDRYELREYAPPGALYPYIPSSSSMGTRQATTSLTYTSYAFLLSDLAHRPPGAVSSSLVLSIYRIIYLKYKLLLKQNARAFQQVPRCCSRCIDWLPGKHMNEYVFHVI
jgi:hypothetical protein